MLLGGGVWQGTGVGGAAAAVAAARKRRCGGGGGVSGGGGSVTARLETPSTKVDYTVSLVWHIVNPISVPLPYNDSIFISSSNLFIRYMRVS